MAELDAQQNFMTIKYFIDRPISVTSKVMAFFMKTLPKLNILSVMNYCCILCISALSADNTTQFTMSI